jgi:hypothetical protein
MLVSASRPRPPLLPPTAAGDAARSAVILAGAGALLVLTTLALSGLLAPQRGGPISTLPTDAPALELGAEPTAIGGRLTITGARDGLMTIASANSDQGFDVNDEGTGVQFERGEVIVTGPDGEVVLSPASGEVTRVEYDDLSFYLDPGDCTATPGGRNEALGLVHLRLDCGGIADIRGGAVIGLEGVIAVPADALGDRGSLPPVGGEVSVGQTRLEFVDGAAVIDGFGSVTDPRVTVLVQADATTGLAILLDPATGEFVLTGLQAGADFVELPAECPLHAEALGRVNPQTTVTRLTIDCPGATLPDGSSGRVSGSIVVDVVDLVED